MKTLYVFGAFEWLESPILIGKLGYESLRGSDAYSFKYNPEWETTCNCIKKAKPEVFLTFSKQHQASL